MTITAASFYSRTWSYGGFGINVTKRFIISFNIFIVVASIIAYFLPAVTSISLKILGSIIGTVGVAICTSEAVWLVKNKKLNEPLYGRIRLLDILSLIIGLFFISLYWITDGVWLVNDILAASTIVACIKVFKIRSLKMGVFMLFSLLGI